MDVTRSRFLVVSLRNLPAFRNFKDIKFQEL